MAQQLFAVHLQFTQREQFRQEFEGQHQVPHVRPRDVDSLADQRRKIECQRLVSHRFHDWPPSQRLDPLNRRWLKSLDRHQRPVDHAERPRRTGVPRLPSRPPHTDE